MYKFSVITPTFNRAHTLHRPYESLSAQSFRDFEWLIVDDGSADDTETTVRSWRSSFPIRYISKANGGKHTAMNLGVKEAKGELVLFFDSDDRCLPHALERFNHYWESVPDKEVFSSVVALCQTAEGAIVGPPFPSTVYDAYSFAEEARQYMCADRWGATRLEVLRQFPFPEGEKFVLETLVWNRIAQKYAARFFNEPLHIYEATPNSLSRRSLDLRRSSPNATIMYYGELMRAPAPTLIRLRAGINYIRFRFLCSALFQGDFEP